MATTGNIYDLLNNEEQHSKKAVPRDGPGKPDKSENRRSAPRAARGGAAAASGEAQQQTRPPRVDDRERRGGRGGARGGRGGRGGYHGTESDGVHRNFDRKQGERGQYAPGEARKHGAVGEVNPSAFQGTTSEFSAQDAAVTAEATAEAVGDLVLDLNPIEEPEDATLTYDEYIAKRSVVDDDVNRQTRAITNDGDFKPVKQFVKVEEVIFADAVVPEEKAASAGNNAGNKKKKTKISLDEFVGERPAPAPQAERPSRGGASAGRGGRGGFQGESRGGRGGFQGERRGGRGGFDGPRGAPRGGRGGAAAPRSAPVNFADQSAFPALSPK